MCCKNHHELTNYDLKKLTNELELKAVKLSLYSDYYRKEMLKLINSVKYNTNNNKIYDKLNIFINKLPTSVDVGVQTMNDHLVDDEKLIINNETKPNVKIESSFKDKLDDDDDKNIKNLSNNSNDCLEIKSEPHDDDDPSVDDNQTVKNEIINSQKTNDNIMEIFGDLNDTGKSFVEEENSKDSLMQNMEDMFCESEDSNDLLSLIDKNSTVKNIKNDILKYSIEASSSLIDTSSKTPTTIPIKSLINNEQINKRKLTIDSYKKIKKRALQGDVKEDKQSKKKKGIWLVERINQITKLRDKMMNISIKNYRKHGRLKEKFIVLFGYDDDADEMMPESPIHIEEHLTSCKERIAPWVVRYLMPYYTKKIIDNKLLFKLVAKHIANVLILQNTFPEEETVNEYINKYFQNKTFIKTENDIYI
ncbi:hypothetical protein HCN44_003048 [Aphidius gifuensis]|uniref:Set2 Rpb1 interacting domain-containing protein n=2 Tax=Aphidius gifuensis TaxID=684658 RepID=A0A834XM77_APHGI|nr:hypothetical protein HCN44_003048 [Aphidius gifuensis]